MATTVDLSKVLGSEQAASSSVNAALAAAGYTVQTWTAGAGVVSVTVDETLDQDGQERLAGVAAGAVVRPPTFSRLRLSPITADVTLTEAESGTVLGTTGTSVCVATLPSDPARGTHYTLIRGWTGHLRVKPAADARLQYPAGGQMADGEYLEIQAGGLRVIYAGTYQSAKRWLVLPFDGSTLVEETP